MVIVSQHSVSPEIGVHGTPTDNFSRSGSGGVNLSQLSVGLDLAEPANSNWSSTTSIRFKVGFILLRSKAINLIWASVPWYGDICYSVITVFPSEKLIIVSYAACSASKRWWSLHKQGSWWVTCHLQVTQASYTKSSALWIMLNNVSVLPKMQWESPRQYGGFKARISLREGKWSQLFPCNVSLLSGIWICPNLMLEFQDCFWIFLTFNICVAAARLDFK